MPDLFLLAAVQRAVFAKLSADVPAEQGGAFQHLLENAKPPFNKIGAIDFTNEGGKGDKYQSFRVDVISVFRGTSRDPLLVNMAAVYDALEGQTIAAEGVTLSTPQFLSGAVDDVASDGVTYAGLQTFEIYAEAADA